MEIGEGKVVRMTISGAETTRTRHASLNNKETVYRKMPMFSLHAAAHMHTRPSIIHHPNPQARLTDYLRM